MLIQANEFDEPDDVLEQLELLESPEILEPCSVFAVDMASPYRHFTVRLNLFPESPRAMRLQIAEASPQFRNYFGTVRHMSINEPARIRPFAVVTPTRATEIVNELGRGCYIVPVWTLHNLIECAAYGLSNFVKWNGDLNLAFVHGRGGVPVAVSFWYRAHQQFPGWWIHARSINSLCQYPVGTRVFQGIELDDYGDLD